MTDGDTLGEEDEITFRTKDMKSENTRSDGEVDRLQILKTSLVTNSARTELNPFWDVSDIKQELLIIFDAGTSFDGRRIRHKGLDTRVQEAKKAKF